MWIIVDVERLEVFEASDFLRNEGEEVFADRQVRQLGQLAESSTKCLSKQFRAQIDASLAGLDAHILWILNTET